MNTEMTDGGRLIDEWFPVAAVDEACGTPAGSGQTEKAIFTWFASRPIAQARAAVLCSLLPADASDEVRTQVELAIRSGDHDTIDELAALVRGCEEESPVVVDCFSGRGIIPLEAARFGVRSAGLDLSPVAALASRLLADWPLRDWSAEPPIPFNRDAEPEEPEGLFASMAEEQSLVRDVSVVLAEVGRRTAEALAPHFPTNPDGSMPWGYLWAVTMPCDSCRRSFPLVSSLVLRHPYPKSGDPGQSFEIVTDGSGEWRVEAHEGKPRAQPTFAAASGRRGKTARCPFCQHSHSLDTVKAKGFAGQFEDVPLVAGDLVQVEVPGRTKAREIERKIFRTLRPDEVQAALDVDLEGLQPFGQLPAAPTERIAPGNKDSVRGTGYGFLTFASLMNDRQVLTFVQTVRAIQSCHADLRASGVSAEYAAALASYAAANLVRRLRRSTRGARLEAYSDRPAVGIGHVFENESAVSSNLDWFETGPGTGPGTWDSLSSSAPLRSHLAGLTKSARPARFRRASATSLPYRDQSVGALVCDPPYYSMIDYADISDLFYVWLRRCLADIVPDLFGEAHDSDGLQDKTHEIIVKRGATPEDHRTTEWYENQLSVAFREMRRVLKDDGVLTVVFGHSDPDAWRRLLGALRQAGFVVTSAWPARTESANTGVASIKVTVTIGCQVAPEGRTSATAAQVEREIVDLVRKRVNKWDNWGLALSDQLMASYGPAMQVVGRYRTIQRPDGSEPDLDYFLALGRRAVVDTHAFKVDELPLDTFDAHTRFAIFWMRAFKRTTVNKGEAVFHAQSSQMRIDELRPHILEESKAGYAITLGEPPAISDRSPIIHVARAVAAAWQSAATEGVAATIAASGRTPDDAHLWATIAELVRQLPESDKVAMALTACQRNRRAIETETRRATVAVPNQMTLDSTGDDR